METFIKLLAWKPDLEDNSPAATLLEEDVPVLGFLRQTVSTSGIPAERQGLVVHTGELSVKERCQINNWIDTHVPGAQALRHLWMSRPLGAHAITIFLAFRQHQKYLRHKGCPPSDGSSESSLAQYRFVLEQAWSYQMNAIDRRGTRMLDVDRECLLHFERRLFERSKRSGVAGFHQWGKDVGDLQQNWSPYGSGPSEWAVGDFDVDDEDILKVR